MAKHVFCDFEVKLLSTGDYHKERTPFLSDYLCHSDDSVSEFTDKMARNHEYIK